MISVLLDRNNVIKNVLTAKFNNFKSYFVKAKHSSPYVSIEIHYNLFNSRMTLPFTMANTFAGGDTSTLLG